MLPMHPAGIKFGLTHDLLQLRRADVVLSDRFFESISEEARRRIRRKNRLTGTDLWDDVINGGLARIFQTFTAPRFESTPFFTGIDRIVGQTLMPLAERAHLGRKLGRDFLLGKTFCDTFDARIKKLDLTRDMTQTRRLCFKACCTVVRELCTENDPSNVRHADLLAVYAFYLLNRANWLEITVFFRTARPSN